MAATLDNIMGMLRPYAKDAYNKINEKKGDASHIAILELSQRIFAVHESKQMTPSDLGVLLTLKDLKTLSKCDQKIAEMVVEYLGIKQNVENLQKEFPVWDRLQETDDSILNDGSLDLLRYADDAKNSHAWFALAPDEMFLSREVTDLEKAMGLQVASKRRSCMQVHDDRSFLEKGIGYVLAESPENLTIGKIQTIDGKNLNANLKDIPTKALTLLSDDQISSLDYSEITEEQLEAIFYWGFDTEILEERIRQIPKESVNDVLIIKNTMVQQMSINQCRHIDVNVLTDETINLMFPGFTTYTVHPGFVYTAKLCENELRHQYEQKREDGGFTFYSYSHKELEELFVKNQEKCRESARKFTEEQRECLKSKVFPEVWEVIKDHSSEKKGDCVLM